MKIGSVYKRDTQRLRVEKKSKGGKYEVKIWAPNHKPRTIDMSKEQITGWDPVTESIKEILESSNNTNYLVSTLLEAEKYDILK